MGRSGKWLPWTSEAPGWLECLPNRRGDYWGKGRDLTWCHRTLFVPTIQPRGWQHTQVFSLGTLMVLKVCAWGLSPRGDYFRWYPYCWPFFQTAFGFFSGRKPAGKKGKHCHHRRPTINPSLVTQATGVKLTLAYWKLGESLVFTFTLKFWNTSQWSTYSLH